jgi:hypothetical protein
MSLRSVPDAETKEFKMSKIKAFRNVTLTQKEVMTQRYGQAHPFWGRRLYFSESREMLRQVQTDKLA